MKVELVTTQVLRRPEFDNTCLGEPKIWQLQNAAQLARYWSAQGNVLGLSAADERDFDVWLDIQHDLELERVRGPHGGQS